MQRKNIPDWPVGVSKPDLPHPYKWHCLRPELGIGQWPDHPWYCRVTWKTKDGNERLLKKACVDRANSPMEAIKQAMEAVHEHRKMRKLKHPTTEESDDGQY